MTSLKNVLIVGANGYVGPLVCNKFISEGLNVTCVDSNWFSDSKKIYYSDQFSVNLKKVNWVFDDIRLMNSELFNNLGSYDTVIYLAAVSNDPIGKEFSNPTHLINSELAVSFAKRCKKFGVKNFLYASSCSVYGGGDGSRPVTEIDKTDPLTDYSQSKLSAELGLRDISSNNFNIASLRFATACGPSVNMRFDLVLNDFIFSAISNNYIEIKSNGKPYRPIINTLDMANAFYNILISIQKDSRNYISVNVGFNDWNFQVVEIAEHVKNVLGNDLVLKVNTNAPDDKRSYCVNFDYYNKLTSAKPEMEINEVIKKTANITEQTLSLISSNNLFDFQLKRHSHLKHLISNNYMSNSLNWI